MGISRQLSVDKRCVVKEDLVTANPVNFGCVVTRSDPTLPTSTKLDREVASKVPEAFPTDRDRLARFGSEA